MPNLKISAMPGLGVNAAPGDLLTIVDVSAPAASANKHETLNNLLSVITRGITDKALRFQTPGTAPAVSLAAQGSIYFDGSNFQISANGGAYAPLLSLSPQADHAVLIGPLSGGPTAPTWRGLALSDLPAIATDRLLGRVSPGSGDVEEITPGAGVLTWLTSPTVTNLSTALGVSTTGSNNWVFSDSPTLTTPRIAQINVNSTRAVLGFVQSGNSVNYLQITNSVAVSPFSTGGPTIESVGTSADVNFWLKSKGGGNIDLSAGTLGVVNVRSLDSNNCGVLNIKDGVLIGAQLVMGGLTIGAPLGGSGTYTLPAADGTSGQALTTDGVGGLSWASFADLSPQADHAVLIGPTSGGPTAPTWRGLAFSDLPAVATNRLLGRVSPSSGDVEEITPGSGVLTWLQSPSSANLALAINDETGSGALVFATSPTFTTPTLGAASATSIAFGAGTASAPSITATGDLDTGWFFPTANTIALTTAGSERVRVNSSGFIGIGNTNPFTNLVLGNISQLYGGGVANENLVVIAGPPPSNDPARGIIGVNDTRALAAGNGGSITFGGVWTSGGGQTFFGAIGGNKDNANSGDAVGNLALAARSGSIVFYATPFSSEYGRFNSSGEFIVGTTDQGAYNLQCNGTAVWGAGAYVNGSDERIKEEIQPIDNTLDVVLSLNPVTFRYKSSWSKDQKIQPGFIAQELVNVFENANANYKDGIVSQGGENKYYSVAYQSIIPLLVKAIQELNEKINAIQTRT